MIENPRWRGGGFAQGPYNYKFVIHETISASDYGVVEIIEIRNGIGLRWLGHTYITFQYTASVR
jgi:hypothetical protein